MLVLLQSLQVIYVAPGQAETARAFQGDHVSETSPRSEFLAGHPPVSPAHGGGTPLANLRGADRASRP